MNEPAAIRVRNLICPFGNTGTVTETRDVRGATSTTGIDTHCDACRAWSALSQVAWAYWYLTGDCSEIHRVAMMRARNRPPLRPEQSISPFVADRVLQQCVEPAP